MIDNVRTVLTDLARQRAEIDHIIVALRQLYGIPEAGAPMTVRALVEAGCIDEAVERVAIPLGKPPRAAVPTRSQATRATPPAPTPQPKRRRAQKGAGGAEAGGGCVRVTTGRRLDPPTSAEAVSVWPRANCEMF